MITSYAIEKLLPTVAQYGEKITAQGEAIYRLSENASAEVASVLGPAVVIGQAVTKAHQLLFAWIMDHATFFTFTLPLQSKIAQQARVWHELRAALGKIAFVRRFPNIQAIKNGTIVSLEEIFATTANAGITLESFWGVSLYGQASLERLVRADLVLTHDIDFDPLVEANIVMKEVSPRVPDVPTALEAIRKARTVSYSDLLVAEGLGIVVQGGDTLPSLASRYLGDSDQWQILAELNGLRNPYITESALDQLGAVVGQKTLAIATVIGQFTAQLTDVVGLYKDQRIRFAVGIQDQILTIVSITQATKSVQFSTAFTLAFVTASVVTIYNPTYDVTGKVVGPGDVLVLPARPGDKSRVVVRRNELVDVARVYGTDAELRQGDLVVKDGDLAVVSGVENLSQAVRNRFRVERGSVSFHPLYGTGLHTYLGWKSKPFFVFLAQVEAQQTVLRDPRVASVENFGAVVEKDVLTLDMTIRTQNQEQFPVPRFTIDVRS